MSCIVVVVMALLVIDVDVEWLVLCGSHGISDLILLGICTVIM